MHHRISSILVLCAGLALAGVPVLACCTASAPAHDCCSNVQQMPGQEDRMPAFAPASLPETCCAAAATGTTSIAAGAARHNVPKHPQRTDPPTLMVSFGPSTAPVALSPSTNGYSVSAYFPSHSMLYLSTG